MKTRTIVYIICTVSEAIVVLAVLIGLISLANKSVGMALGIAFNVGWFGNQFCNWIGNKIKAIPDEVR